MADDAVTFITALGFDKVDIFSFSLGGMIAQALVVKRPELVRKLILTGTGPAGGKDIDKVAGITYYDLARAPSPGRTRRSSCSSTATPPASAPPARSSNASRSAPWTATPR
jgi:pimeloyl-ACP methyl ester carboxylesterase